MNYYLMDKDFRLVTLIEVYESLIWTNRYYDIGDFELYVPTSEESIKLYTEAAKNHYYIVRDDDDPTNCRAMIINKISSVTDFDGGNHIAITGTCLKGLLSQRIVWGKTNLAGDLESEIRRLVYEQAISPSISARVLPHLVLGDETGVNETINTQLNGTNLASAIIDACRTKKVGWDIKMNIPLRQLKFTVYKGIDRSFDQTEDDISQRNPYVVFSPEYDNLLGTTYNLETNDYKNIALVGGEITETNPRTGKQTKKDFSQIAYPYKKTTNNPSGYDRYEIYVDGSDLSDDDNAEYYTSVVASSMRTRGQQTLDAYKSVTDITGDVVPNLTFDINKDYCMGDLVVVQNEYKQTFSARVIEIVEVEELRKKTVTPKFVVENYEGKEPDNLNPVLEKDMRSIKKTTDTGKTIYRVTGSGEVRVRGCGRKLRDRTCLFQGQEISRHTSKGDRSISVLNKVYPDEI